MRTVAPLLLCFATSACSNAPATVSEPCVQLLECIATVAADSSATANATYGGDSACWETADAAETCTAECEDTLSLYHSDHPTQPACDDGVETGSNILFPSGARFVFLNEVNNAQCDPEIGVSQVEVYLESDVTATFEWSGELHGAEGDTGFQSDYASSCTLIDTDWECVQDPTTVNVGERVVGRFDFHGTFSATGETSTAVLGYDISDASGACNQTQSMSGSQP